MGRIAVNLEFASDRACRSVFCEDELLDSAVLPDRVDRASALIRSFRPATLNEAFWPHGTFSISVLSAGMDIEARSTRYCSLNTVVKVLHQAARVGSAFNCSTTSYRFGVGTPPSVGGAAALTGPKKEGAPRGVLREDAEYRSVVY